MARHRTGCDHCRVALRCRALAAHARTRHCGSEEASVSAVSETVRLGVGTSGCAWMVQMVVMAWRVGGVQEGSHSECVWQGVCVCCMCQSTSFERVVCQSKSLCICKHTVVLGVLSTPIHHFLLIVLARLCSTPAACVTVGS